jgi:ferritin-like metal-binding protein YciE
VIRIRGEHRSPPATFPETENAVAALMDDMAAKQFLKDLLQDEIKDLYSAEKQLLKAIPKMAKSSTDEFLRQAFKQHLAETQDQVTRLEQVAQRLGMKPTGKKCMGMEGVIKEGAEALAEKGAADALDIGIIGAGSRVEYYEMSGYVTAISLAKRIGATEVVGLLTQTLTEEQNAEKTLRKIAIGLIRSAPTEN